MAKKASASRLTGLAEAYEKSSKELERRADAIRAVLIDEESPGGEAEPDSVPEPERKRRASARGN